MGKIKKNEKQMFLSLFPGMIDSLKELTPDQAYAVLCGVADYIKSGKPPRFDDLELEFAFNAVLLLEAI